LFYWRKEGLIYLSLLAATNMSLKPCSPFPLCYNDVRSVPEQISELGVNYPHSIALSDGDRQLSYEDLNRKADQFAGYLAHIGIVPGSTVAICMERSFEWIVAALGVMRAGAAYVPLDSSWPDVRLRFAVNDSGATALVARTATLDRLQIEARGLDPWRDAAVIADAPVSEFGPIEAENLAYVIYTSGSTGVPKGVEITHANLAHLTRWHRDTFHVTGQDRASHLMGLGFDAAVLEIWPHLWAGATLCLANDAMRSSPELIQHWMVRERVTIGVVPALFGEHLMTMAWSETTALRLLIVGGDALHHGPSAQLPFEVVNHYGPTECSVVSTWSLIKPGMVGAPPIGFPVAGASIYLLDERGKPVPEGEVGEIYVGGSVVGRGYRNLPELTNRSFLPDPFSEVANARMYRTGDRGMRRPDGEIEFRGRLDRQTKIRGQRVELDEIGSVLSQHPSIGFGTATTTVSEGGENQLVAYVLPKEHVPVPTARQLKRHLSRSLPRHMIPSAFVRLDALPISPNGKLELNLLPQPTEANILEPTAARTANAPVQEKLLAMVRDLLENDTVQPEDNFFLVGGHSLLGMQLVMRLRGEFGVGLTLQELLEEPTVRHLAVLVETKITESRLTAIWKDLLGQKNVGLDENFFDLGGGHPDRVAALQQRIGTEFGRPISIAELFHRPTVRQQAQLKQRSVKAESALAPGVLGLHTHGTRNNIFWVHYVNGSLANAMGPDQPFFVVTLTVEDVRSLGDAPTLQNIAKCHLRKILATQPKGPYIIGGQCLGGILAYEIACQLRTAGYEVALLVLLDAPNLSYVESQHSLMNKFNYLRYLPRRAAQLGLRASLLKLRACLPLRFTPAGRTKSDRTEIEVVQETIETAAHAYHPEEYAGNVLLLLAADRPHHVNYLPGWQAVVPNLHTQYVDGRHEDLLNKQNVSGTANAIVTHIESTPAENLCPAAFIFADRRVARIRRSRTGYGVL
jgi:amino acid adenylation domain-containing protein